MRNWSKDGIILDLLFWLVISICIYYIEFLWFWPNLALTSSILFYSALLYIDTCFVCSKTNIRVANVKTSTKSILFKFLPWNIVPVKKIHRPWENLETALKLLVFIENVLNSEGHLFLFLVAKEYFFSMLVPPLPLYFIILVSPSHRPVILDLTPDKKWSFPLQISPVNVTKSAENWKT